ncbi:GntR family transcriptional regulator [Streptomyces nodosus]|nr:GntR family transcriptional regulator [Streptomyces nodosus]
MTGLVPSRHHDIADDLRQQITTGRVQLGERLPSEAVLAERYAVSTVTLRHALAVLQGQGLVEKIHGKGNFVRRPLRKIMYVGDWGILAPWTPGPPLSRPCASPFAAPRFRPPQTCRPCPLAEFSCFSLEGESPRGLARIYMPRDLAPAGVLDDESGCRAAVRRFAVLGPPPAAVRETVCARPPTPDEATALRIGATAAVLAITRIATDATGRVVEAGLLSFPGDRVDAVFTVHHVTDDRKTRG